MSSVPCSSSIRFLYWSFSFIDVDTLLPIEVDCLLPFVQRSERPCPLSRLKSLIEKGQAQKEPEVSGQSPSEMLAAEICLISGQNMLSITPITHQPPGGSMRNKGRLKLGCYPFP